MPSTSRVLAAKRPRGRPVARWLTCDEVAEITRTDAQTVARLLDTVPDLLPGAERDADGWRVPERALRVLLGAPTGPLPPLATVPEVARCLRVNVKTVYAWAKLRRADGEPVLPVRLIMGALLVDARDVLALPARSPAPRPLFLSEGRVKR